MSVRRRKPKLPGKPKVPSFLTELTEPKPPVESIRLEFSMNEDGQGRVKLIVVASNGFVFTDETDIDSETVTWRFEDGAQA